LIAVRPYADLLDLVSATAPDGIGSRGAANAVAATFLFVLVVVMSVSPFGVFARLEVRDIHFFCLLSHVVCLSLIWFGLRQSRRTLSILPPTISSIALIQ
jgi:hypothetical protein